MKKLFIIIFLLVMIGVFAEEISPKMTILEISKKSDIPPKKLKLILGIEQSISNQTQLSTLKITQEKINLEIKKFQKEKRNFYQSIVMIGMVIVFASLLLVGIIIGQLKRLQKPMRSPIKKISVPQNIEGGEIIAITVAIFLHENEAEEQNKMILTLDNQLHNVWSAGKENDMPNRKFFLHKNR